MTAMNETIDFWLILAIAVFSGFGCTAQCLVFYVDAIDTSAIRLGETTMKTNKPQIGRSSLTQHWDQADIGVISEAFHAFIIQKTFIDRNPLPDPILEALYRLSATADFLAETASNGADITLTPTGRSQ